MTSRGSRPCNASAVTVDWSKARWPATARSRACAEPNWTIPICAGPSASRHHPRLARWHEQLCAQKGIFKANAIVANQLGRALYFMLKNGTAFDLDQWL